MVHHKSSKSLVPTFLPNYLPEMANVFFYTTGTFSLGNEPKKRIKLDKQTNWRQNIVFTYTHDSFTH